MAEKEFNLKLTVESDKSTKNLKSFKDEVKSTDKALGSVSDTSKDLNQQNQNLAKSTETLTDKISKGVSITKDFSIVLADAAVISKELASGLATIATNFGPIGLIKDVGNSAIDMGKNIALASAALSGLAGIAATQFLGAFTDANSEMANVNSILLESDAYINNLSEDVRDLALSFKLATETEITKGLYDVASAGLTGSDGMKVMTVAVKEAKAGLTDVKTAAKLTTQTLLGMGESADQAEHTANVLFKTVQRGVLDYNDLAQGLGRVIPMAKSLSLSLETVGSSLAVETRKGSTPEQAFTNLTSLLVAFSAQSEQSKQKAKELGIEMDANAIRTKGFATVLEEMLTAAEKSGNVEQTLFTLLGRQEAVNAALQVGASRTKELRLEQVEFAKSGTALNDSLAKQENSLKSQIDKIKVAFDSLRKVGGETFADLLQSILPKVEKILDYLNALDKESQKWLFQLTALTLAAPGLITAMGGITLAVIALIAQITIVKFVIGALGLNISVVTGILGRFAAGVVQASASVLGLSTSVTTGNAAITLFKASLAATMVQLAAFSFAIGGVAFIVYKLTKAWADYKIEVANIDKQDKERFGNLNEQAKKLKDFREKEQQGIKLTSKEYEDYAKTLMRVAGNNEIIRKKYAELMELSKARKKEESEALKFTGLTDEQQKEKLTTLKEINEAEIRATKNTYQIKKYEADQWLEEEKAKLKDSLFSSEEIKKAEIQLDKVYKKKLSDALTEYNKEIQAKQKEAEQKKEDLRKKEIDNEKKKLEKEILDNENALKKILLDKRVTDEYKLMQTELTQKREAAIYKKYARKGILENPEELNNKALELELKADATRKQIKDNQAKKDREAYETRLANIDHLAKISPIKEDEIVNHQIWAANEYLKVLDKNSDEYKKILETKQELEYRLDNLRIDKVKEVVNQERSERKKVLDQEIQDKKDAEADKLKAEKEKFEKAQEWMQKSKAAFDEVNNSVMALATSLSNLGLDDVANELYKVSSTASKLFQDASTGNIGGLIATGFVELTKDIGGLMKRYDEFTGLVKENKATQEDLNNYIIQNSVRTLPLYGDAIGELVKKFTDWAGITRNVNEELEKQQKQLELINKAKEMGATVAEKANALEKEKKQLIIDNIDDEKERAKAQLQFDLDLIEKEDTTNEIKYQKKQRRLKEYVKWESDYTDKTNNEKLKQDEKYQNELESNRKKAFDKLLDEKTYALKLQKEQTENLIKQSQLRIGQIDYEVNKIKSKYDKLRETLSPDASKQFQSDRNMFLSNQKATTELIRTPVSAFELSQESEKENVNNLFLTGAITQEEKIKRLKELAVKANIYYGNVAKNLVKGTREQFEYQKKANDAYSDYRELVSDTYDLKQQQESASYEKEKKDLQELNDTREQQVKDLGVQIDNITLSMNQMFKDAAGQWKQAVIDGLITPLQSALNTVKQIKDTSFGSLSDSNVYAPGGAPSTSGGTLAGNALGSVTSSGSSGGTQVGSALGSVTGTSGGTQFGQVLGSITNPFTILPDSQKRSNIINALSQNDFTHSLQWFWDEYGELSIDALKAIAYERGLPKYDSEFKYYRMGSPVIDRPTRAVIGEAGPEKVINAQQMEMMYQHLLGGGGMAGGGQCPGVVININNPTVRKDSDLDVMARKFESIVSKNIRKSYR